MFFRSSTTHKRSLYSHLIRGLIPGLLIMLLISGLMVKTVIGRNLQAQFDRTLDRQASAIIGITEQDEDGVELEIYEEAMPAYFLPESSDHFEVHDTAGNRLFASESMIDSSLGFQLPPSKEPVFEDATLANGLDVRLVHRLYFPKIDIDDENGDAGASKPFYPAGQVIDEGELKIIPTQVVVTIATSRHPLKKVMNEINGLLLISGLITTVVLVLLQLRAIKSAARPINALATELNSRSEGDMTDQVMVDSQIVELDMLATRFNGLLESVNQSMVREKAFSSNLAHEIRTPIAEMQSLLEVNNLWPEDPEIRNNLSANLLSSLKRMELLVTNILAIGRGEAENLDTSGRYSINDGLNQLLTAHRQSIEKNSLRFELNIDAACAASSGSAQWPVILNNLISNAVEHSPSGSTISVNLTQDNQTGQFDFRIANPAGELDHADMTKVFDRLWQKDKSRTSNKHNGLGLSLVKTFSDLLGYRLDACIRPKHVFEIRIQGHSV